MNPQVRRAAAPRRAIATAVDALQRHLVRDEARERGARHSREERRVWVVRCPGRAEVLTPKWSQDQPRSQAQ